MSIWWLQTVTAVLGLSRNCEDASCEFSDNSIRSHSMLQQKTKNAIVPEDDASLLSAGGAWGPPGNFTRELEELFWSEDIDGDGSLSLMEFHENFGDLLCDPFELVDMNQDGNLSQSEINQAARDQLAQHRGEFRAELEGIREWLQGEANDGFHLGLKEKKREARRLRLRRTPRHPRVEVKEHASLSESVPEDHASLLSGGGAVGENFDKELEQLFLQEDMDADGFLSRMEFNELYGHLLLAPFDSVDWDHDGNISQLEVYYAAREQLDSWKLRYELEWMRKSLDFFNFTRELEELFWSEDIDADGSLNRTEFSENFGDLLCDSFDYVDMDHGGNISKSEFDEAARDQLAHHRGELREELEWIREWLQEEANDGFHLGLKEKRREARRLRLRREARRLRLRRTPRH